MRKTLLALTATASLIGFGSLAASATPVASMHQPAQASAIQQADWYCGPHCEYWHHRRWQEQHERWRESQRYYPYYSYNRGYYGYNGYYYR